MFFDINPYYDAFVADCEAKGLWRQGTTWEECFKGLGFSSHKFHGVSYKFDGYNRHQLSDDEFVIFVLRYS